MKINKFMFFALSFLFVIVVFELIFLSLLQKDTQLAARTALAYSLSASFITAGNQPLCLAAKAELQYQGMVSNVKFLDDRTLQIGLRDKSSPNAKGLTFNISIQSLSANDENGKKMNIKKIKVGDAIKISFFDDHKQLSFSTVIDQLPNK